MAIEFKFTKEQQLFRRMVRDFAHNELRPKTKELDREEHFPMDDFKKMAEAGLTGIMVPRKYGGSELGLTEFCILEEELSKAGCASHGEILGVQNGIGGTPILLYGTKEQKERYLPKFASGEWIAAFALTEPNAGSDAGNLQMSAVKDGDEYILNGTKQWITNGKVADAVVTMAVTDKTLGAHGGITAFIVDTDTEGFSVGVIEEKMGNRASKTSELIYDNVRVPEENIIGRFGAGLIVALSVLDEGRIILGAGALGGAKGALQLATQWANKRKQYGRPLANKQAIQWMLADSAIEIRPAEYMTYHTAIKLERLNHMRMRGESVPRDIRESVSRDAAIVKAAASEIVNDCVNRTIQVMGGMGYTGRGEIERSFRDSRILRIYEGTNEIQRLIISRDLIHREGVL